jgi:CheY-like chemotaxis protein
MKRILLVEDDYDVAQSVLFGLNLLEAPGLEKEVKYEGISALERVQAAPAPDLLILDMHLPNVAGQDIYEMARKVIPDCKIIIITADVRLIREIHAREGDWETLAAPDDVFSKPFSLIEFLESVGSSLGIPTHNLA